MANSKCSKNDRVLQKLGQKKINIWDHKSY